MLAKNLGNTLLPTQRFWQVFFQRMQPVALKENDPNNECVAAEQQCKKKAASKGKNRSKSVQIVLIEGDLLTIPKRAKKEVLEREGKVKSVDFYRHFSSEDVNQLLTETFSNLGKARFVFLQPHKSNKLTISKEQNLDGNAIFQLAKNGTLYLQYLCGQSSEKVEVVANPPADDFATPPVYNQAKAAMLQQDATRIVEKLRVRLKLWVKRLISLHIGA